MQKNCLYISNFKSGAHGASKKHKRIVNSFTRNGFHVKEFYFNIENDHISEDIKTALVSTNYERVFVYGGDGTINTVANVILKNNISTVLGVIPGGTCNDLARELGMPIKIEDCLPVLVGNRTKAMDVGFIENEGRYFLSSCAGGNFASVSFNTSNKIKKLAGKFSYYFHAFLSAFDMKKYDIIFSSDVEKKYKCIIFMILNGSNAAGFTGICPDSNHTDGKLEVAVVKDCSFFRLLLLFMKVMRGTFCFDKNVEFFKTGNCDITVPKDMPTEIDGEKCSGRMLKIKIIPSALNVVYNEKILTEK